MTTNNTSAWKTSDPESVGLYVASVERRADTVRYWTGKHWTVPCMVYDMHLPGRTPTLDSMPASPERAGPIQWLEPVVTDAEGFMSWGGLLAEPPLRRDVAVEVRLRDGARGPERAAGLRWDHDGGPGDIVAYRVVDQALAVPAPKPANEPQLERRRTTDGVGDIASDARGSGARFNTGKPDLALIPLRLLSEAYVREGRGAEPAVRALGALGWFQETHEVTHLFAAMALLGLEGWEECAHVFTYGAKKYAAWNWSKGMAWSIPLACAARHTKALIDGQLVDPESDKPHRGHVFCNVVMLLAYKTIFPEGNDLPTHWLRATEAA